MYGSSCVSLGDGLNGELRLQGTVREFFSDPARRLQVKIKSHRDGHPTTFTLTLDGQRTTKNKPRAFRGSWHASCSAAFVGDDEVVLTHTEEWKGQGQGNHNDTIRLKKTTHGGLSIAAETPW